MSRLTIIVGIALVVLGIASYVVTGGTSLTALIPAAFGVVYFLLGYTAMHREALHKHMMHVAALLSIIAIIANIGALGAFAQFAMGQDVARPAAVVSRALMAIICAVQLVAAIRSFLVERVFKPAH